MSDDGVEATVAYEITTDFILDLYDQYREMEEEEEVKTAFLETIKHLSDNIGEYLVLTEEDVS
jgi:hypothetical protein